jgi:lipid II:glycine glycyltransferase (peptidoglycan interpeptide bridge formation enzyme)
MEIVNKISAVIIQPIINLIFAAGLVFFLYGVAEYLMGADSPEKRQTGAKHMFWGIIGLAIMTMVWGILQVIQNTLYA